MCSKVLLEQYNSLVNPGIHRAYYTLPLDGAGDLRFLVTFFNSSLLIANGCVEESTPKWPLGRHSGDGGGELDVLHSSAWLCESSPEAYLNLR